MPRPKEDISVNYVGNRGGTIFSGEADSSVTDNAELRVCLSRF